MLTGLEDELIPRAYKWEAQDPWARFARVVMLIGGSAYLAHLVRDAFTAKSLPMI